MHKKTCVGVSTFVDCNFIKKETTAHMFSYEFFDFFYETFFSKHFRWLLLQRLSAKKYFIMKC